MFLIRLGICKDQDVYHLAETAGGNEHRYPFRAVLFERCKPARYFPAVFILYGLHLLPDGSRKGALSTAVEAIFVEDFAGRLLAFDSDAADAYARIAGARKSAGRPISQFDAMIAACTRSRGAALATRNVKDFTGCEVAVINPWAES